jgi:hypothetical protein
LVDHPNASCEKNTHSFIVPFDTRPLTVRALKEYDEMRELIATELDAVAGGTPPPPPPHKNNPPSISHSFNTNIGSGNGNVSFNLGSVNGSSNASIGSPNTVVNNVSVEVGLRAD